MEFKWRKTMERLTETTKAVIVRIPSVERVPDDVGFQNTYVYADLPGFGFTKISDYFEYVKDAIESARMLAKSLGLPLYIAKCVPGYFIQKDLAYKDELSDKEMEMLKGFVADYYPYNTKTDYIIEKAEIK